MHDEVAYVLITALVVVPLVLLIFWLLRVMSAAWTVQSAVLSLPTA